MPQDRRNPLARSKSAQRATAKGCRPPAAAHTLALPCQVFRARLPWSSGQMKNRRSRNLLAASALRQDSECGKKLAFCEIAARAKNHHHARGRRMRRLLYVSIYHRSILPANTGRTLVTGFLLYVPAELESHSRENFPGKVVFAP